LPGGPLSSRSTIAALGRLPEADEFAQADEIATRFGSLKRAFAFWPTTGPSRPATPKPATPPPRERKTQRVNRKEGPSAKVEAGSLYLVRAETGGE
jgi:hypothetical protein